MVPTPCLVPRLALTCEVVHHLEFLRAVDTVFGVPSVVVEVSSGTRSGCAGAANGGL